MRGLGVKKSVYNILTTVLYKILVCTFGIIIPRFFILNYGSEINGLQGSVSQIFMYISLLEAGVGAATLQAIYRPVYEKNYDELNGILSASTLYYNKIGLFYFVVLCSVSVVYAFAVPVSTMDKSMVLLYIVISGAATGINFFYKAKILLVMSAVGDNYVDSVINMAVYTVTSILKIILILNRVNIVLVQLSFLTVNVLATLVYYFFARKRYPWLDFHCEPNYQAIEQKNSALIHKISSVIFQNIDIVLLTFLGNLRLVSIYSMYKLVMNMIASIVGAIGDGMNFLIGQSYNGEDLEEFTQKIDAFNVYYSAVSFALFSTAYLLTIPFLKIYTNGMDIDYIVPGLPLLFVIIELLQVGREAMVRTINVAGKFKATIYSTIIETGLNLLVSLAAMLILYNRKGETYLLYGALLGTIVSLLFRTFDINRFANRKILFRKAWRSNKIILTNAAFFVAVVYVETRVSITLDNYFSFFQYGLIITPIMLIAEITIQSILNPSSFILLKERLVTYFRKTIKKGQI